MSEKAPSKYGKTIFLVILALFFMIGVFLKQFSIYGPFPIELHKIFTSISFIGALSILMEYAWKIRDSWYALIPFLLSCELLGDALSAAGMSRFGYYLYFPGAMLFPIFGVTFIIRGFSLLKEVKALAIKMIVLGITCIPVIGWEYITYHPKVYNKTHLGWRALFLGIFAILLFIDFTTDFKKYPQLKVEKEILRVALFVIMAIYFIRFIFI